MYALLCEARRLPGALHEVGYIPGGGMRQHGGDIGHGPLITGQVTGNSHHDHDHEGYGQLPQCGPDLEVVPASNRFSVTFKPGPESFPDPAQVQRIEFASQ